MICHRECMQALWTDLGIKYSRYYTKEEYEAVQQSNEGHYEGIGVVMMQDKDSGMVQVAHCYEGVRPLKRGTGR